LRAMLDNALSQWTECAVHDSEGDEPAKKIEVLQGMRRIVNQLPDGSEAYANLLTIIQKWDTLNDDEVLQLLFGLNRSGSVSAN
jgi:hypothetical protein